MWFDPGLARLFITSTLLHLGEDINLLVVSDNKTWIIAGEDDLKCHIVNFVVHHFVLGSHLIF